MSPLGMESRESGIVGKGEGETVVVLSVSLAASRPDHREGERGVGGERTKRRVGVLEDWVEGGVREEEGVTIGRGVGGTIGRGVGWWVREDEGGGGVRGQQERSRGT